MSSSLESVAGRAIDLALTVLGTASAHDRIFKTDRDFATRTDFAIEDAVRDLLAQATPGIGFLGEERGHTGNRGLYWCLDPIDGTTNFTRGLPNFGVALALVENGQPVHGWIALPCHGERYAIRDGAAWLNGEPITTVPTASLPDAVVSVGDFATGPGSAEKNRHRLAILATLADTVGRVRMLGSAATDLAWLAAGRLDAVVIDANNAWDVAAGIAIARAAGAIVTHLDGTDWTLSGSDVLAAAPQIHHAITAALTT